MFITDASSSTRHGCQCSMIQPVDEWMSSLESDRATVHKPGSSATTGNLILETEAGPVGRSEDRTANWPVN